MKTKNPLEIARELKVLKKQHGTNGKVATLMNISEAQVSRYIALLDLPLDIQAQVASGDLPVSQPLKALKRRDKKKPSISALNDNQRLVIQALSHVLYATQSQLARYAEKPLNTLRTAINDLAQTRFLEASKELRPFVYRLSSHGATIAGTRKPRHWMSANAIHQRVLRNEIELSMREKNHSAQFIERTECWKRGLFPSIGEHLLTYTHQGKSQKALVIIDDYLMAPTRIERSLNRLHDKEKSYAAGDLVIRWIDIVDSIFIYTTDPQHQREHVNFIDKHLGEITQPIIVRYLAPIWEVA